MAAALPSGAGDNNPVVEVESDQQSVELTPTTNENRSESDTDGTVSGSSKDSSSPEKEELECPICLQPCLHPVELPCHHIFCYLCIKGVAIQGAHSCCPICRATIPRSVLTNPNPLLKDVDQLLKESSTKKLGDSKDGHHFQWYYESRSGGWWQYDKRTIEELEKAYASSQSQPTCQLLIAGLIYVVDFEKMIQYQKNNNKVVRRIKRGEHLKKRGVAGLFTAENDDEEDVPNSNSTSYTVSVPTANLRSTRSHPRRRRRQRLNPTAPSSDDS
ncbi:unnamed protein product [Orchesella dallaii]|uniref:E3 ubiquitin-protein ligase n=1 Tax=Orchesella dallaii TaxID=48710 RepID=A0ABP1SAS9_9HEXA